MRAVVNRLVYFSVILTGSSAAYPQYNFPDHLPRASAYWSAQVAGTVSFPSDWSDWSAAPLNVEQQSALVLAIDIWKNKPATLAKEDLLFLDKYGYLGVYLSGLNPMQSGAHDRSGPWMLTYPDARRYGLVVNEHVDERRDLAKSTRAARMHFEALKDLHGENTELAFVMGSAGMRRVSVEERSSVEEHLAAIRLLARNHKIQTVPTGSSGISQTFQEDISVDVLLSQLAITEPDFRRMNPTLVGTLIPAGSYVVLPEVADGHQLAEATRFLAQAQKQALDSVLHRIKNDIPSPETHEVVTYRVKSGDVLGKIAARYGVSISKIKKWNKLRSDRIDINQKLTIYYPKGKALPRAEVVKAKPKEEEPEKLDEMGSFTIYVVQPGDTLWAISKRFEGVKPEQIMAWNNIGEDLSIGQKLKIKVVQ